MAVFYGATSLDGFLAGPNDEIDWLKEPEKETYTPFIKRIGAVVMGSSTYEFVLKHGWPYTMPGFVFTTRDLPPTKGVTFVKGNVADHHAAIVEAAGGKEVWVVGGGDLVGQYLDAGLLDEMIVQVAPVTLGAGKPLLPRRVDFVIHEVVDLGGMVELRMRPA